MRNENTTLQLEREKYESFRLEIFLRSRLLSMTGVPPKTFPYLGKSSPESLLVSICYLPLIDWSLNCWSIGETGDG